jgi:hypothetical protein
LKRNEDIAYGKIISYTNVTKIKKMGSSYLKLNVSYVGDTTHPDVSWKVKCKRRTWSESRNSNGAVVVVLVVTVIVTELT